MSSHHLPPIIDTCVATLLNERVPSNTITMLVSQYYGKTIIESFVLKHRNNLCYSLLKESVDLPYRALDDCLIVEFSLNSDVRFVILPITLIQDVLLVR